MSRSWWRSEREGLLSLLATPFALAAIAYSGTHWTTVHLSPGECVTLLGPSGSGKTMLLRALADLDPNAGEVSLNRIPRSAIPAPRWRRAVTYVAAKPGWWADRVSAHYSDWPAARFLAERLALPEDCGAWPVDRLSTGEAQRLGLVRALVQTPQVLLLDEPTGGPRRGRKRRRVEALIRRRRMTAWCRPCFG